MTETDIKKLQTDGRFSDDGITNFYLLLYLPLGFIIAIIRILLGLIIVLLGSILPDVSICRNLLMYLFRAIFGIIIHSENKPARDNLKLIISNCVSPLDHFVVHIATGCILPCQTNLGKPLSESLGLRKFGDSSSIESLKKSIGTYISNNINPIFLQPEEKITNGQGLLRFKEWPFSFTNEVQPISLKIRRPIFKISITTITSSYWSDVFWYLFSPWTVYNLRFLKILEKGENNDEDFAEKVRQDIAEALHVIAYPFDSNEVIEWEKRYLLERRRARMVHNSPSITSATNNPEIHRMARQVKEVLPTVPYNIIFKDLVRTKNVDVTISNILEGHVAYTPEASPTSFASTSFPTSGYSNTGVGSSLDSCRKASLSTAAPTFPKSAHERMQSFQERKLNLIMSARKRYMDKHGLNALASNNC